MDFGEKLKSHKATAILLPHWVDYGSNRASEVTDKMVQLAQGVLDALPEETPTLPSFNYVRTNDFLGVSLHSALMQKYNLLFFSKSQWGICSYKIA